jgi:hypothetical protein
MRALHAGYAAERRKLVRAFDNLVQALPHLS